MSREKAAYLAKLTVPLWCTLLIVAAALLTGCTTDTPASSHVDLAPLTAQIGSMSADVATLTQRCQQLEDAAAAKDQEIARLQAIVRADAEIIYEATQEKDGNWSPFIGLVAKHQISFFPRVQSDTWTLEQWHLGMTSYKQGGVDALQSLLPQMQQQADNTTSALDGLNAQIKDLTGQRNDALHELALKQDALQTLQAQLTSKVAEARAAERAQLEAENIRRQQWVLNGAAALCVLVSLASIAAKFWLKMDTGMLSVALGLVGAPACLALGQATGKSWFLPVACTVAGVVVIAAGLAVVRGSTAAKTAKAAQTQLELTMSTMTKIVRRLDTCYEDTGTTLQSLMDKTPARPAMTLSDLIDEQVLSQAGMTDDEKAEVHRLRMVAKQAAAVRNDNSAQRTA